MSLLRYKLLLRLVMTMSSTPDELESMVDTLEHDLGAAVARIDVLEALLTDALNRIEAIESAPAVMCDL